MMQKTFQEHLFNVEGSNGWSIGKLNSVDLNIFREIVFGQFFAVIKKAELDSGKTLNVIEDYHKEITNAEHKNLWPKQQRILTKQRVETLLSKTKFFMKLREEVGELIITDEEKSGFPEIYFRVVRPEPHTDYGPIHADRWFWDLGHGKMPENRELKRLKFWFSLVGDGEQTGFTFISGSHLQNHQYASEYRDGMIKPTFDAAKYQTQIETLKGKPGTFIIFNDDLLHGGCATKAKTRLSCEFTLLYQDKR